MNKKLIKKLPVKLQIVTLFHSRKTKTIQKMFGSSIIFSMRRCSAWWDKLMEEKESLVGTQLDHTFARMISILMKLCADTILILPLLSLGFMKRARSVSQQKLTSPRKRSMTTETSVVNLFMFLLLSRLLTKKKSALSIWWEISKMLHKASCPRLSSPRWTAFVLLLAN